MADDVKSGAVSFFQRRVNTPEEDQFGFGVKPVTVRLEEHYVYMADVLAKKAGVSRSSFLATIIETGIHDILQHTASNGDEYLTFKNLFSLYHNGIEGQDIHN